MKLNLLPVQGMVIALLLVFPGMANALDCSRYDPDAVAVEDDPDMTDEGKALYRGACTVKDYDQRTATDLDMDYYTRSKARCDSLPNKLEWVKDQGSGYNRCIFRPDDASGVTTETPSEENNNTSTDDQTTVPQGPNSCRFANDNVCDEPSVCSAGTDTNDCISQPGSTPSQDDSASEKHNWATLKICNKFRSKIFLALNRFKSRNHGDETVEGWWTIMPGNCSNFPIDRFQYSNAYFKYYAESENNYVWQGDSPICIPQTVFARIREPNYNCGQNEHLRKFVSEEIKTETKTINLR